MTTEVRQRSATGGEKGKKPQQMSHIPPKFLLKLSEVYSHAQESKYKDVAPGVPNWTQGYPWSLSYDAMMRHLNAFWLGEYNDPEDGLPHLCHAAWHCATLFTWFEEGIHPEYDDRPKYYHTQEKADTGPTLARPEPTPSPTCPSCGGTGKISVSVVHPTNPMMDTWATERCGCSV